jgi:hypothetical protein
MKDEELKLEEIETSHALGGAGQVTRGDGEERLYMLLCWHTHLNTSVSDVSIICHAVVEAVVV